MSRVLSSKIKSFVSGGAIVEGKGSLLAKAALVIGAVGFVTLPAPHAGAQQPDADYRAMVEQVQSRIDAEMPWTNIHVLDITRPAAEQIDMAAASARDAQACLVYSSPATISANHIRLDSIGDVGPRDYGRWIIWTDVASCLGAKDPMQARAFGAFMTHLDTGSKDFPRVMAEWEALEQTRGNLHPSELWGETATEVAQLLDSGMIADALDAHGMGSAMYYAAAMTGNHDLGIAVEPEPEMAPGM